MGIKKLQRANGQVKFEADVRIVNMPRKTAIFDSLSEAQQFISQVKFEAMKVVRAETSLALQAKIGGQRSFERAHLAHVIEMFRKNDACSKRGKKSLVKVADFVGGITVGKADEHWAQCYYDDARKRKTPQHKFFAPSTIRDQIQYMAKACKWWAKQNRVPNAVVELSAWKCPAGWDNQRDRRLENGEYEMLMKQIGERKQFSAHYRCLVDLCLETGARMQELVLARWSEIQREDRLWKMPSVHTKKKRGRKIPLSPKARATIAELRLLAKAGDSRLFEPLPNPSAVSNGFRRIVGAAKIKDLKFHDLRHESISRMVINYPGIHVRTIMEIVGHRDYASFVRYAHLRDDDLVGLFD